MFLRFKSHALFVCRFEHSVSINSSLFVYKLRLRGSFITTRNDTYHSRSIDGFMYTDSCASSRFSELTWFGIRHHAFPSIRYLLYLKVHDLSGLAFLFYPLINNEVSRLVEMELV